MQCNACSHALYITATRKSDTMQKQHHAKAAPRKSDTISTTATIQVLHLSTTHSVTPRRLLSDSDSYSNSDSHNPRPLYCKGMIYFLYPILMNNPVLPLKKDRFLKPSYSAFCSGMPEAVLGNERYMKLDSGHFNLGYTTHMQ